MTSSDADLAICGIGAVTPVGRSAWSSAAAVRAGVTGFAHHPLMSDREGRPIAVAMFPWVEPTRGLEDRVEDALAGAIAEAVATLGDAPSGHVGIVVNLPGDRPGRPSDPERAQRRLLKALPWIAPGSSAWMRAGHAGGLLAIQRAGQWLESKACRVVVVAAADSYLDLDVLEWLEETGQLHGAGARNNAWGFVPGEGAAALALATRFTARELGLPVFGVVRGVGADRETKLIRTGEVCLGAGLTEAVRQATRCLEPGERLSDVYCDLNGEPYRADEYAFTVTRTRERFADPASFVAPADCWGDVGAASSLLGILLACIAGGKRYALGRSAMVWASSVGGERCAAVIATR